MKRLIEFQKWDTINHVKDVIVMLREYVKVGEVEKKKYGEVLTPLSLVKEMIQTIPNDFWKNPNSKILDSCNGVGPFLIMVIYRLMLGLKDWEPDEEKRYKHIVENMVYAGELQPKNMFLWLCAIDPQDEYLCNIFTGSFLSKEFDEHMKNVWGVEKFDLILGNPPYQDSTKISRNSTLWTKFLLKSDRIIKGFGYLLFITPNSWMGPTENQRENIKSVFNNNKFIYLNLTCGKYFGVGSTFSFYLIQKSQPECETIILNNDGKFSFYINDMKFLPNNINKTTLSIIKKFFYSENSKMGFTSNLRNDNFDDNGNYLVWYSNNFKKSKIIGKNSKVKKIIVNLPGYLNPRYDDGVYATSKNNLWVNSSLDESVSMIKYLNSKLIKFLVCKECKYSGFNNIGILKLIPNVNFKINWTDQQLYEYFNLSQEEIDLIETTIK